VIALNGADDIGRRLVAQFQDELKEQVQSSIALHIFTKVRDARNDPDFAGRRWPFELIQNAHDAGPREGRDGVTMSFKLTEGVLRVEHDAAPFSMADFTALLTGGSSKDFRSTVTTGRFGSGFLVTHVLSQHVDVFGVLEVENSYRSFNVELDRPDDEELILQNIKDSEATLRQTSAVIDFDQQATAIFEYAVDDEEIASTGLHMLEQALPHLFGTCRRLRKIIIERDDREVCWTADDRTEGPHTGSTWKAETDVSLIDEEGKGTEWRVVRFAATEDARGWLVVALSWGGSAWSVCERGEVPSVFRQLPLIGAPELPGWVIVDGNFDVDQERSSIHVIGDAGQPLRDAFAAVGPLVLFANEKRWAQAHRLAQLALPAEGLGDSATKVWREILSTEALKLARLPLVRTARGEALPSVFIGDGTRAADFIRRPSAGPNYADLWELAATCTENDPPAKEDSAGWSEIAEGWEQLGVEVPWIDLKVIGERAADEGGDISELPVAGDPYAWLARYLAAVGKTWKATGVTKTHVEGLLPDQHGVLHSAGELRKDGGVSEQTKAIGLTVGLDFKAKLLNQQLIDALKAPDSNTLSAVQRLRAKQASSAALYAIGEVTGGEFAEGEAVTELVDHLSDELPEDQRLGEDDEETAAASIALLEHLWTSQGEAARDTVSQLPFLVADGTLRKVGPRRLMVLPVAAWPEAAQPFAEAYPANRVLAEDYAAADASLLEALVTWGVAHRGLLVTSKRDELRDRALKVIAANPEEVANATLRGTEWMQIALLEPEVLVHCKQSPKLAEALLGFVVCYAAPNDASWRSTIETSVRTPQGEKRVHLTPSLWLSDLRSKEWVPVQGEESITHHIPNRELVRKLVDPVWLAGNRAGAEFLVVHFGLDALEVSILAAAKDEEGQQRIRDSLAKIVEVVGDNSQMIDDLATKAKERSRDVDRMRRLGLAVQECVKQALERHGLNVEDVDHGYDFAVTEVEVHDDDPEDLSASFDVDEYKIEVKATLSGEARLTPLQAMTCAEDSAQFVLCVVDLRKFEGDVHQVDWATTDISGSCKLLSGERLPIDKTLSLVRDAEQGDIPIRNVKALRYAVGPDLWENGLDFDEWVEEAFPN
jgi:hypothetical protein